MICNLIDKVAKGDWSPHEPIQQSVYIDSEPQIRMIPFDKYVSQCCQKEQVDRPFIRISSHAKKDIWRYGRSCK